jgi:hypothetical protein
MLELTAQQRRFVLAYISDARDHSRCAAAAGYSTRSGGNRVAAHHLLRSPRIVKAIREEADKRLNSAAFVAVSGLVNIAGTDGHKDQQKACDSILDRVGMPRKEVIAVTNDTSEEFENVSTEALLRQINELLSKSSPAQRERIETVRREEANVIDGDYTETPAAPARIDAGSTSRIYEEGEA